jgi:hypothetical protein
MSVNPCYRYRRYHPVSEQINEPLIRERAIAVLDKYEIFPRWTNYKVSPPALDAADNGFAISK